jgi:hypothetical protein
MTSRKRLVLALGIGLLTSFASLSAAEAQYGYPPPPPRARGVYRSGFTFGGAIGFGLVDGEGCTNPCGGAFMGELHMGGMLNPRLALMGDVSVGYRAFTDPAIGDGSLYNSIWTIALQYWVNDILWLKGGFGFAHLTINDENTPGVSINFDDESGGAVMGAIGVEVLQSYNWALDLQARASHAFYDGGDLNNLAFMVGFNWY